MRGRRPSTLLDPGRRGFSSRRPAAGLAWVCLHPHGPFPRTRGPSPALSLPPSSFHRGFPVPGLTRRVGRGLAPSPPALRRRAAEGSLEMRSPVSRGPGSRDKKAEGGGHTPVPGELMSGRLTLLFGGMLPLSTSQPSAGAARFLARSTGRGPAGGQGVPVRCLGRRLLAWSRNEGPGSAGRCVDGREHSTGMPGVPSPGGRQVSP